MDQKPNNEIFDEEKKLVMAIEDTNNIRNFWEHFKIPTDEKLFAAIVEFEKAQTYDNQERVKVAVCNCIATSTHPAFMDAMVAGIREESTQVMFHAQFDKDLTEVLTTPVVTKTTEDK